MRNNFVAGLVAAAVTLAGAIPAAAEDTRAFKPTGQWTLDYGEDYCRLLRPFSDGKSEVALAFERIQPGPFMRMVLVGQNLATKSRAQELEWNFEPSGTARKARHAQSKTDEKLDYLNLGPVTIAEFQPPAPGSPPPAYDRAAEKAAAKPLAAIAIDGGMVEPMRIDTGSLESAIGALQACADDLAGSWGLDRASLASSTPAMPVDGGVGWLGMEIPFNEYSRFAGGGNQVRLMVDAAGEPTSCHIHWPTLSDTTNKKICSALMRKAKFMPAKDASGTPITGFWVGSPLFLGPPMPGGRRG